MFTTLFRLFLDICLFRQAPQDLPTSQTLLMLALAGHVVAGWILATPALGAAVALTAGILDTAVLAGLTYSLLSLQNLQPRFQQTTAALAGTGAVISLLATPLVYWLYQLRQSDGDIGSLNLLILLLMIWSIAVTAHILRHALSTNPFVGALLAMLYFIVTVLVRDLIFPMVA